MCELGITLASKSVDRKSNEIPAVQDLLKELDISGCMVVAEMHLITKKDGKIVIDRKGDYLLNVKGNQAGLEADIADYVQNPVPRKTMDASIQKEKNRGQD